LAVAVGIFSTVAGAQAHHGKDFLLAESYEIPHPWDFYFASSLVLVEQGGRTELELEPSILFGVFPRLAFELHAHTSWEEREAPRFEAVSPAFHLQITPPESNFPVRVGLSGEYEFGVSQNDRAELRLVVERDIGRSRLAANLIGQHEFSGDSTMGYAAGYRYEIIDRVACGVEGQGEFTQDGRHEVIAAIYGEPNERLTLKVGIGAALSRNDIGPAIRTGVVYRF
jgi:hypothetical protein